MGAEPQRFEDILSRLTEIVERLESGELSLEESLSQFEEGVKLSKAGASVLDDAERRIEVLLKDGGGERVAPLQVAAAPSALGDDDIPF